MTYCDICHSRIYTYKEFKIDHKTACYHCKIRDLEEKLEAVKTELKELEGRYHEALAEYKEASMRAS